MIQRCENPNYHLFHRYGKRGITVCERWRQSVQNFLDDMGTGKTGWSIHRVNNDAGYFLENMVWALPKCQSRCTGSNLVLTVRGETDCLISLCEHFGVPYKLTQHRIWKGWSVERAFFTPKMSPQEAGRSRFIRLHRAR